MTIEIKEVIISEKITDGVTVKIPETLFMVQDGKLLPLEKNIDVVILHQTDGK